jgi:hypothetical protein
MLKDNVPVNAPLDFIKAQKLMEVEMLSKAMTENHEQMADEATRDCKAAFQKHNDMTHVQSPNFQVGVFQDKVLNVTVELAQNVENNNNLLNVVSEILDARYSEQEMFHML